MPVRVTTPNNPSVSYGTDSSPLHVAVRNHKHEYTRRLIQAERSLIDKPLKNGWTALMIAAEIGCTEAVSDLIRAGANKEAKTHGSGRTALMIAADLGHAAVVDLLLNAGANKEAKSKTGQTACEIAALRNHHNVVSLFKSAQVTQALDYSVNPQGYNALHTAVRQNDVSEVTRLIKAGYDISRSGPNGWTALMLAAEQGFDEILTLLLAAGALREAKNGDGYTSLMLAALHGRASSVKLLLEAGANRQAVNPDGINARRIAALGRDDLDEIRLRHGTLSTENWLKGLRLQAVVKVFVDDEVDRTVLNANGRNGLHEAVLNKNIEAIKCWLNAGLPVNNPNREGRSALLLAVEDGYREAVNLLLNAGADKEAETPDKMTPLLLAVSRGHTEIVRLLLMAGVNLAATNLAKETAIDIAQRLNHTEILALLTQAETDKKTAWLGEAQQIFQEAQGLRAERLDYAWKIYQQEQTESIYKQNARRFLLHILDIAASEDIEEQLTACMAERAQYKDENRDYIPGKLPKRVRDRWRLSPAQLSHLDKNQTDIAYLWSEGHVLQRNAEAIAKDKDYDTRHLSCWEQAPYQVGIYNKLFTQNGDVVDTTTSVAHGRKGFAAVIWKVKAGEILLFNHKRMADGLAHSSMLGSDEPLLFSGEIKIEQGRLIALTLHSGHYKPTLEHARHFIKHLERQGVDVSEVDILTFGAASSKLPHIKWIGIEGAFFRLRAKDVLNKPDSLRNPTLLPGPIPRPPVEPKQPSVTKPVRPVQPKLSAVRPQQKTSTDVQQVVTTIQRKLEAYKNSWWTQLLLFLGNQSVKNTVALVEGFPSSGPLQGEVSVQITTLKSRVETLSIGTSKRLTKNLDNALKELRELTDFVKNEEAFQQAKTSHDTEFEKYEEEHKSYITLNDHYQKVQSDYSQERICYLRDKQAFDQAWREYQAALTAANKPMEDYQREKADYYQLLRQTR